MSTLFSAMKPALLTRYVEELGRSEGMAGLLVALPFVGIASASILMRRGIGDLSYTQIAIVFGGGLVALEALSALTFSNALIVGGAQFLTGICVGVLMGTIARYIARSPEPARLFGFVDMMAVALMSFMVYAVGLSVEANGLRGGYLIATAIGAALLLALFTLRPSEQPSETRDLKEKPLEVTARNIAVVGMGVLFVTFSGLGFTFMFTLAADLGMAYDVAGTQIGILLFLSALACQAGGWASTRFGPERPLAIAFIACAVGWYGVVTAESSTVFLFSLVPAVFSLQFNFPILLSFCGSLDTDGRWAAIGSPLLTSGFAWASILAGLLVSAFGIGIIPLATGAGMLACLCLLGFAYRRG